MFKKYRLAIPVALLVISMILLSIPSAPRWIGLAIMVLAAILMLLASRGSFYYTKGNKLISGNADGNLEKALRLYEKADKLGVPNQYEYVIGTIFMQFGDIEKGKSILEKVEKCNDKKLVFQAKLSLSMYYWIEKDIDKAIALCESARDLNLNDRNLYINLGTYYLAKGRAKDFKALQREAYQKKMDSIPLIDLEAEYLILNGNYRRAGNFLLDIFNTKKPTFIDPYLHFAIVYMNYGEIDHALQYLRDSLTSVTFSNVSIYKKADIERIISLLENEETRYGFIKSTIEDPLSLMNGTIPKERKNVPQPEFLPLPLFKSEGISNDDVKADDEIDTSLNDEDEEWLRKHNS